VPSGPPWDCRRSTLLPGPKRARPKVAHRQAEHAEAEELLIRLSGAPVDSPNFDSRLQQLMEGCHSFGNVECSALPGAVCRCELLGVAPGKFAIRSGSRFWAADGHSVAADPGPLSLARQARGGQAPRIFVRAKEGPERTPGSGLPGLGQVRADQVTDGMPPRDPGVVKRSSPGVCPPVGVART